MTFDVFSTGMAKLNKDDRIEIVGPDDTVVAGPLIVQSVFCVLGDWIHLVDESGANYMEGNVSSGNHLVDTSHLPAGWRFKKLVGA